MSGRVLKSNPWFTLCWIPIIPLSIKGYKDVTCHICNFRQPLENRPDVTAMANGGGAPPPGQWQPAPPQQQGWSGPPPQAQQPARYG
ncbi:unnamed protein product [Parascedosporium putredinis]|uniref:Uncharacterized protein n=1 Tax=Parascedosporium putredinis TaxID=1442378 RepID=A0A9P1HCA1_9PEZI|nr:unnamed protein product [Parascedosporium putredinis]CAI8003569.1 unnamed protein product [Parascedosporium putredinis]